jgi:urease accessory protein
MLKALITLVLGVFPAAALAHTGHGGHGFAAGFGHPITGVDHLLAMLAVGIWAAQVGGRARWALPGVFVGLMALGALAAVAGFALPTVELGIAGSVIVFGMLVAFAAHLPLAAGIALTGLLALFHGFAHGTEMAPAASLAVYGSGFLAATTALHGLGLLAGSVRRIALGNYVLRIAGASAAVAGAFMLPGLA